METTSFYEVVVIALATAAISLTTSRGRIFAPLREWVASKSTWFGELFSCFYCTSHWVAIVLVAIYKPVLVQRWLVLDLLVSVFVVVAIAAIVCGVFLRLTSTPQEERPDTSEELQTLRSALEAARGVIKSQQDKIRQFQEQ